jgi:hypothetical protein
MRIPSSGFLANKKGAAHFALDYRMNPFSRFLFNYLRIYISFINDINLVL